jgi:uncharacterized protein (TIGR02646 family)
MTRIEKSLEVPEILKLEGVVACRELKAAYESDPDSYQSRDGKPHKEVRKFKFKREIYADREVVNLLRADQHHKCCFCEASFLDTRSGDVEHYRPKSAVKSAPQEQVRYPGYYWLAYEWQNLLLSCSDCNQKYKRNHFALEDEEARLRSHLDAAQIGSERPLLLNPLNDVCVSYIQFVSGEAVAVNLNPRGNYTIRTLDLNRMVHAREAYLLEIKKNLMLSQIDEEDPDHLACASQLFDGFPTDEIKALVAESKKILSRAATSKGKFSACIRANFPELPTHH